MLKLSWSHTVYNPIKGTFWKRKRSQFHKCTWLDKWYQSDRGCGLKSEGGVCTLTLHSIERVCLLIWTKFIIWDSPLAEREIHVCLQHLRFSQLQINLYNYLLNWKIINFTLDISVSARKRHAVSLYKFSLDGKNLTFHTYTACQSVCVCVCSD